MRPKTIAAITAVAAIAGSLLATPSSVFAQAGAAFRTPGEAAYCNDYSGELICWTPNDGFTVHMTVGVTQPEVIHVPSARDHGGA